MKIQLKFAAALVALLMISNNFPVCAASTDIPLEAPASSQNNALLSNSAAQEELETVTSGDHFPSSGDTLGQAPFSDKTEDSGMTVPDEAPMFSAYVAYTPQGFVVKGTFTELLAGTSLIQFLYSLDGEVWQTYGHDWISAEADGGQNIPDPTAFQNLVCLQDGFEPLSSYIAGQYDRFYLKLQITLENGLTYETQAAVIDRNNPLTISEELTPVAGFTSTMRILQRNPLKLFGQYQITVCAEATPEDISALLPDTLPMEVQLFSGNKIVTKAIVNCPITWKPLSLPHLTPGESVTIADAAEEIIIPAGTLLNTPTGIFQLNEPLGIVQDDIVRNEIRLVLNVVSENADPTGVLINYYGGLKTAFHLKPTGATAIRAYTLLDGAEDWVELPDSLPLEEVNAPSSIANSAYTFVLQNTSEPYQSYLAAWNAGDEPVPFLVGLKVEGGVYDGKQLILAWPDTYERLTTLPSLNGYGGNESNAGSDNKNDSTPEGQRPGLPQDPTEEQGSQQPKPPQNPNEEQNTQQPEPSQNPKEEQDSQQQQPEPPQNPNEEQNAQQPEPPQNPKEEQNTQQPEPPQDSKNELNSQQPGLPQNPQDEQNTQESKLPQNPQDEQNTQEPELPQSPKAEQNAQEPVPTQIPAGNPKLSQSSEYKPETQAFAPYLPEAQPERQPDTTQTIESQQTKLQQTSLHRLLFSAAAIIAIGIGIIVSAGKLTAGSVSGRISVKIVHALYRLLHLK